MTIERLLTRKDIADRWGVCVHTVSRNQALKEKARRISRKTIRWREEDVLAAESAAGSGQ
jgi:hypothetical protein